MNRNDILETAKLIINGEREGQYGAPEDSFNNIARLWGIYLGRDLKPSDVANLMVLMKVARNMNGVYKADNWVDMAGYSALGGELQTLEEQKTKYKAYWDADHEAMCNITDTWKSGFADTWKSGFVDLRNVNDTNMFKEDK